MYPHTLEELQSAYNSQKSQITELQKELDFNHDEVLKLTNEKKQLEEKAKKYDDAVNALHETTNKSLSIEECDALIQKYGKWERDSKQLEQLKKDFDLVSQGNAMVTEELEQYKSEREQIDKEVTETIQSLEHLNARHEESCKKSNDSTYFSTISRNQDVIDALSRIKNILSRSRPSTLEDAA